MMGLPQATAPQNVSIEKVAQGYAIKWSYPQSALKALLRYSDEPSDPLTAMSRVAPPAELASSEAPGPQAQGPTPQSQLAVLFASEYREKGGQWQSSALTRDHSHLFKDFKPGTEYSFRVLAFTDTGVRSAPSAELSYLVPGEFLAHALLDSMSDTSTHTHAPTLRQPTQAGRRAGPGRRRSRRSALLHRRHCDIRVPRQHVQ